MDTRYWSLVKRQLPLSPRASGDVGAQGGGCGRAHIRQENRSLTVGRPRHSMVLAEFHLKDPKSAPSSWITERASMRPSITCRTWPPKIAFWPPHKLHSAITRENDYRTAMEAAGLPSSIIGSSSATIRQGRRGGFGQLQALVTRPTAILCSNDMTAVGVLRAAYMGGLRVPDDSRHRLDDIRLCEFTLPHHHHRLSRFDLHKPPSRLSASRPKNPAIPR